MPQDDKDSHDNRAEYVSEQSAYPRLRSFFKVPGPVRQLFDKFPLITYPPNQLPQRSPRDRENHTLYIFTTQSEANNGDTSFNPSCLKWQAYLKFARVQFRTVPSTNHSSPTGSLPFLLASVSDVIPSQEATLPTSSNRLQKWISEQGATPEEPSDIRYDAYLSLIDHRIRRAWLYALYLEPRNFTAVARRLYVQPCSSSSLVSATIAYQLRAAAEAELLKHSVLIDIDDLYSEADNAFDALSTILGENTFFFNNENPGLFDASVFAYTHLFLDEGMGWKETKLIKGLKKHKNLIQHRQKIYKTYFGGPK
ncbi:MAG: hypothetical protein M1830_003590 [Pleopsidium flavum]|nr:MAG: hypothetical protein M1830_003590 [Pleopsidium flavum]